MPHGWKTGITAAAGRHFHAATVNSPTFEFLSPLLWDSPIRTRLVHPEPAIEDGRMPLPVGPGLGIELDPDAVERFRVDRPSVMTRSGRVRCRRGGAHPATRSRVWHYGDSIGFEGLLAASDLLGDAALRGASRSAS